MMGDVSMVSFFNSYINKAQLSLAPCDIPPHEHHVIFSKHSACDPQEIQKRYVFIVALCFWNNLEEDHVLLWAPQEKRHRGKDQLWFTDHVCSIVWRGR